MLHAVQTHRAYRNRHGLQASGGGAAAAPGAAAAVPVALAPAARYAAQQASQSAELVSYAQQASLAEALVDYNAILQRQGAAWPAVGAPLPSPPDVDDDGAERSNATDGTLVVASLLPLANATDFDADAVDATLWAEVSGRRPP